MIEVERLTEKEEAELRRDSPCLEVTQLLKTLDAEREEARKEIEALKACRDMLGGWWARDYERAIAAEAERDLLQDLLARYGDRVRMSMSARPKWQEAIDAAISAAAGRAALAKEKPDAE